MSFVFFNGMLLPASEPLFTAQNRGLRYGDGLFETIKVINGSILLEAYHFDRLFAGLQLLQIKLPLTFLKPFISSQIIELCKKNKVLAAARVRLAVYRGDDNEALYVIEAMPLSYNTQAINEGGWKIDFYPFARKSCDAFANLKSANYLPYVMADRYAEENGLDECLVLNNFNAIADASKANLFLIKDNKVLTPALNEGCVNGVMRRYVIEELKKLDFIVHQTKITEAHLLQSDEVFLTNAINGIRWVGCFRQKTYTNQLTQNIYRQILG